MRKVNVKLGKKGYEIIVGSGIIRKLPVILKKMDLPKSVLIVTNSNIASFHGAKIIGALKKGGFRPFVHFVPDSESAKSAKQLFGIYKKLLKHLMDRASAIVAFGGGVVGDLSGFAAASYMRGVKFINVPTTLLAQVDSAIGGKTGINLPEAKNLVGAFYQPELVLSDVDFLKTLKPSEINTALAEIIKYGVIWDGKFFRYLEKNISKIKTLDARVLEKVVYECSKIKAKVVEADEKEERGIREILNFGHTFGHALEAVSKYKRFRHGEAVGLGMLVAARLGVRLKMFTERDEKRIERLIKEAGLPSNIKRSRFKIESVVEAMKHDKKKKRGKMRFVLPVKIGKVALKEDVRMSDVRKSLKDLSVK